MRTGEINPFAFVAGAAHIDILAKAVSEETAGMVNRPGKTSIEIGGTAANIAINLCSMGSSAKLLTALPEKSAYASLVKLYLQDNGVDLAVYTEPDMGNAALSVHADHAGEVISAITESPLDAVQFPDPYIVTPMAGAYACIVDCNLSERSLLQVSRMAVMGNIPLYVVGVSEDKISRILALHGLPIRAIFISEKEMVSLTSSLRALSVSENILAYFNTTIVVTRGARGVSILTPGESSIDVPAVKHEISGNFLGGGDAVVAGVVLQREIHKDDMVTAIHKAMKFSASVITRDNCGADHQSSLERAITTMDEQAFYDPMTKVLNRRGGEKKLAESEKAHSSAPYHIAMVDIDHFKRVNDTYGHDVGDEVIKLVAKTLSDCLRAGDHAIRWGGEEFVALLNRCNRENAAIVAERIRSSIEKADIPVVGKVTISIGLASSVGVKETLPSARVMKMADEALYVSKQSGRNRVTIWHPAPNQEKQ